MSPPIHLAMDKTDQWMVWLWCERLPVGKMMIANYTFMDYKVTCTKCLEARESWLAPEES